MITFEDWLQVEMTGGMGYQQNAPNASTTNAPNNLLQKGTTTPNQNPAPNQSITKSNTPNQSITNKNQPMNSNGWNDSIGKHKVINFNGETAFQSDNGSIFKPMVNNGITTYQKWMGASWSPPQAKWS